MTEERRHRAHPSPPTPAQVLGPAAGIVAVLLLVALAFSPGSFVVRAVDPTAAPGAAAYATESGGEVAPTAVPPIPSTQAVVPRQDPQVPAGQAVAQVDAGQVEAALVDLLQVRDRAVAARDATSWQATVGDPRDGPAGDDGGFSVLASLPVTGFESSLVDDSLRPVPPDGTGEEPAEAGAAQETYGSASWQARVQTDYELAQGPAVRRNDTVVVSRTTSGAWQVDSWEPFPAAGDVGTPAPWELGPVHATVGERAVVLAWSSDDTGATTAQASADAEAWGSQVLGWADAGAVVVDSYLGTGWPRSALLLAPATAAQYDALVPGEPSEGSDAFAAVTTDVDTPDGPGDLVVLNPGARADLVDETWQVTVTHELVHVASGARFGDTQEIWLAEGLADLIGWSRVVPGTASREQVAGRLLQRVAAGEADTGSLPDSDDFSASDADRVGDAYEGSWLAVLLLQDEIGVEGVLGLYAAASDGEGDAQQRTDQALRDATGEGREAFQERWRTYLTGLAAG